MKSSESASTDVPFPGSLRGREILQVIPEDLNDDELVSFSQWLLAYIENIEYLFRNM